MEFSEKLQELRKCKGLTQEELAQALYVSRTAVSKWESGRGMPNIESLKDISMFFNVSIDELLSAEKLLFVAEKENKSNIRNICDLLFGTADIFSLMLIVLPIYPNAVEDFVYSVNLPRYTLVSPINSIICWLIFSVMIILGILRVILTSRQSVKLTKLLTWLSLLIGVFAVIFLAITRVPYAVIVSFLLLILKSIALFKIREVN